MYKYILTEFWVLTILCYVMATLITIKYIVQCNHKSIIARVIKRKRIKTGKSTDYIVYCRYIKNNKMHYAKVQDDYISKIGSVISIYEDRNGILHQKCSLGWYLIKSGILVTLGTAILLGLRFGL